MPEMQVGDALLHYQIEGRGRPLVLLNGLGFGNWSWFCQIPALSRRHTVIAVENRGIGQSRAPAGMFTIADMADDAAALIRGLGFERVHVLGASMGGYIAQELVLRHPGLVDRLVLACTSAGGTHAVPATPVTLAVLMAEAQAGWTDEILARGAHLRFSDACLAGRQPVLEQLRQLRRLASRDIWQRQITAAMGFTAGARLSAVRAPTLVSTGDDDPIVPPANAEILARLIPGAQLSRFVGGRHLYFMEFADRFNREALEFLDAG